MPNYIPPPKDPSYLKRKMHTTNKIKISNETNPVGQHNIEISTVDSNDKVIIKQYQLYPEQLKLLLEKNTYSNNPSSVEYVQSDSNYSSLTDTNQDYNIPIYSNKPHPEYTNSNNPSHFDSYKQTMNIKNGNQINNDMYSDYTQNNVEGFSDANSNYSTFNFESQTNTNMNQCNRQTG